jgi:hypothetical protein
MASEHVLQKFLLENKFPELTTRKPRVKLKTILTENSAQMIKLNRCFTNRRHLCPAVVVATSTFIRGGVCISIISVPTSAIRYTNLYLSLY